MSISLDQLKAAKTAIDGEQDKLLEVMAVLAATRHITIIPRDDLLISKPTIILPARLYERIIELYGKRGD